MNLFRRRTPRHSRVLAAPRVRLRISTADGPVTDVTSDDLYYIARFADVAPCTPACLPGCDKHGWLNLIAGGCDTLAGSFHGPGLQCPAGEFSTVPLKIEIKPA